MSAGVRGREGVQGKGFGGVCFLVQDVVEHNHTTAGMGEKGRRERRCLRVY